jgi:hypothetical protein
VPRLESFSGDDLTAFGDAIRAVPRQVRTMEESANRVVDLLWDGFRDDGSPDCALVRLYKTHPYGGLPDDLRAFARSLLDEEPPSEVRCLTLLATRGLEPAWNDRRLSEGHRAIPLPSVEFVQRLPMVTGLVQQLGLDPTDVVRPEGPRVAELAQRTYGVFHVEKAHRSPFVPAQEFVERHGVASALGFGGVLYTGDFFAVVMFARVPVTAAVADRVRILSLATRVALMPFSMRVFS